MTRYASNDIQPADSELDQFWGKEPTQPEINDAVGRHAAAFDELDIGEIAVEHGSTINRLLSVQSYEVCGMMLDEWRKQVIARRASMELYGNPDVIKSSEVVS